MTANSCRCSAMCPARVPSLIMSYHQSPNRSRPLSPVHKQNHEQYVYVCHYCLYNWHFVGQLSGELSWAGSEPDPRASSAIVSRDQSSSPDTSREHGLRVPLRTLYTAVVTLLSNAFEVAGLSGLNIHRKSRVEVPDSKQQYPPSNPLCHPRAQDIPHHRGEMTWSKISPTTGAKWPGTKYPLQPGRDDREQNIPHHRGEMTGNKISTTTGARWPGTKYPPPPGRDDREQNIHYHLGDMTGNKISPTTGARWPGTKYPLPPGRHDREQNIPHHRGEMAGNKISPTTGARWPGTKYPPPPWRNDREQNIPYHRRNDREWNILLQPGRNDREQPIKIKSVVEVMLDHIDDVVLDHEDDVVIDHKVGVVKYHKDDVVIDHKDANHGWWRTMNIWFGSGP